MFLEGKAAEKREIIKTELGPESKPSNLTVKITCSEPLYLKVTFELREKRKV